MAKIYMTISREKIEVNTDPKNVEPSMITAAFTLLGQTLMKFVGVDPTFDNEAVWGEQIPTNEDFQIIATIKGIGPSTENN